MPVNGSTAPTTGATTACCWFAVEGQYGGPAAYQRFVDACHRAGLGVIQDVVYNHLGPSGNYLPRFGPYLKQGRNTWGDLVNLDGEGSAEVRRYILDNVRMWLEDYHVDGLRLDAVHALQDSSPVHLLEEMSAEVDALSAQLRPAADADRRVRPQRPGAGHAAGGGRLRAGRPVERRLPPRGPRRADPARPTATTPTSRRSARWPRSASAGFFHDGTFSSFRERDHGAPIDTRAMPTWRLVVCSQNHDQVGNRAAGDRFTEHLDDDQLACAALLTLCGPFTPMLFQGEEWAASTPFQFFT